MKAWIISLACVLGLMFTLACGDASRYNAPADHTVSNEGAMHKPGQKQPTTNCVSCHGADLKGGTTGVSCFECHDKEW